MKRVLVCGSRGWRDVAAIRRRIEELPASAMVIHGGAWGADRTAGRLARERGLHVAVIEPLWERFGGSAGHRRNVAMLSLEPDIVIAFSLGTGGTEHMVTSARAQGIPVEVIQPDDQSAATGDCGTA